MSEDGGQMSEDGGQKAEDRGKSIVISYLLLVLEDWGI